MHTRSMIKRLFPMLALTAGLFVTGCAQEIPPRLEVRDVASGRTYYTYQPWGQVTKGIGYEFTDIETGKRVTLTNYELKTIEGKHSVPGDSPEAQSFKAAKMKGGVQ